MLLTERELTDEEAAEIMGWPKERVSGIRKVYVDDSRIVMAIAEHIAARRKSAGAANWALCVS
jgi:hypothetical protein